MNAQRAGLHLTVLREVPVDPVLREHWNALVLQTHSPQVFYTYEWARAVQLAYGATLCPLLLLAHDQRQQLIGLAALAAPRGGPVSFLCASTGDYCDFVVSEQYAAVFAAQVFEALREQGHHDIVLTNFPEDSPSYAALVGAARPSGFYLHVRTAYVCAQVRPAAMVDSAGRLALPRQKMVRRSLRAMSEVAPLMLVRESSWEEVRPRLPEFFRAHAARFLFTDRLSNMLRPERRLFLSELARLLSPTGWLCLTRLNVGPRTVSWNYGFTFRAAWFWYQPTFANDLEKYSPGLVLLSRLIEEAAQDPGVDTVDLGLGAEAYKEAFANTLRRTMYVTLHRSPVRHWKEMARDRAVQATKAWPRCERALRTLAAKAKALNNRRQQSGVIGLLERIVTRARRWLASREEVFFFEAGTANRGSSGDFSIYPLTYELLAQAAIEFYDDDPTLQYLLRSARRLREGKAEGFALVGVEGSPLHFAWGAPFDDFFLNELKAKVKAPSEKSVLIFDCWTPGALRGRGHYSTSLALIAQQVRSTGKQPWIFSASTNAASLRGIEKAGFERRYSLIRRRILGMQTIQGQPPLYQKTPSAEVSASI